MPISMPDETLDDTMTTAPVEKGKSMKRITCLLLACALVFLSVAPAWPEQERPSGRPHKTHLVQVVLLVGKITGASAMKNVPANTHKALEDIRGFLPFKSYEHLDTSLIRSNGNARGLLKGPNGTEYILGLSFRTAREKNKEILIFQRFHLSEGSRVPDVASTGPGVAPRSRPDIISTSFSVEVGETIVVGTSRLNGGEEALIVLLTAIP